MLLYGGLTCISYDLSHIYTLDLRNFIQFLFSSAFIHGLKNAERVWLGYLNHCRTVSMPSSLPKGQPGALKLALCVESDSIVCSLTLHYRSYFQGLDRDLLHQISHCPPPHSPSSPLPMQFFFLPLKRLEINL